MTVPDVRVTSVRRTVGVAVALVTGQALLCGIIGIVTFTGTDASTPGAQAVEPQLAGPPVVVPSAGTPPAGEPAKIPEPGTTSSGRMALPAPPTAPAGVRDSGARELSPSRATSAPPRPAPRSSSTERALLPPPRSTAPQESAAPGDPAAPENPVPAPAVERERCDDEGATGRTAAGRAVRCERGRDGDLRWRLV